MKNDDMKLINESGYPSYMTITRQEMEPILDSFWNIFKSIKESVKLLWSTFKLNLNVLDATFRNNSVVLQKSFDQFKEERAEYNKEMKENLKYFAKAYGSAGTLEGVGSRVLVAAFNPLMFFGFGRMSDIASGKGSKGPDAPGASPGSSKNSDDQKKSKGKNATDRVKNLLKFFGYSSLNEAAQKNDQQAPAVDQNAINKLNTLVQNYVANEKKNMEKVLGIAGGYISLIKKISDAKNFDELVASYSSAEVSGIKISSAEIKKMSDSIKVSIQKQSKDDPKKFAETIAKLRKERPELKSQDDVTAAMSVAFSVVKSDSQKRFTDLYNKSVANAQKTIDPNLDQESLKVLSASQKGKEYLNMIADFNNKLRSGQSQMSNLKT